MGFMFPSIFFTLCCLTQNSDSTKENYDPISFLLAVLLVTGKRMIHVYRIILNMIICLSYSDCTLFETCIATELLVKWWKIESVSMVVLHLCPVMTSELAAHYTFLATLSHWAQCSQIFTYQHRITVLDHTHFAQGNKITELAYAFHTTHFAWPTTHFMLHALHSTLHALHDTLHTSHFAQDTA